LPQPVVGAAEHGQRRGVPLHRLGEAAQPVEDERPLHLQPGGGQPVERRCRRVDLLQGARRPASLRQYQRQAHPRLGRAPVQARGVGDPHGPPQMTQGQRGVVELARSEPEGPFGGRLHGPFPRAARHLQRLGRDLPRPPRVRRDQL
jgi:hypothetical protein